MENNEQQTVQQEQQPKAKKPIYKKWWFWVIIIVLVVGIGGGAAESDNNTTDNSGTQESQTQELTAEQAKKIDSQMWDCLLQSEATNNKLIGGIDENTNALTLYDLAKECRSEQSQISSTVGDIYTDNTNAKDIIKEYYNSVSYYITNGTMIADCLMDYANEQEVKTLSEAKGYMEDVESCAISALGARMDFLSAAGLSDDEITSIIGTQN